MGGECVGEKLPLMGTQGFEPLQTIYMLINLFNTLQENSALFSLWYQDFFVYI